ncbi:MAG: superoxide dismutase [Proteobacteria bacterium]|nr:superoxide dismutase [Pseudomonadota bacterium]
MAHQLPELPYAQNALEPVISKETIEYHYGKHHQGYVNKLNAAIEGTAHASLGLEELILKVCCHQNEQALFNNAAQVWNHTFYWNCMSPNGGGQPTGAIAAAINKSFGDFATFKDKFSAAAAARFGSGWAWLVKTEDGLAIETTPNAETPLTEEKTTCLLTLDVWEHAYYIDYRNARPKYIEEFWKVVNWDFATKQLG